VAAGEGIARQAEEEELIVKSSFKANPKLVGARVRGNPRRGARRRRARLVCRLARMTADASQWIYNAS
jgi:hypothetical protein